VHVTTEFPRLAELLAVTSERRFLEQHTRPFLVIIGRATEELDDDLEFYTSTSSVYTEEETAEILDGKRLDPNAPMIEVAKRQGANPFSALVTIGRADNCDIVLGSKSISKFHAYIASIPQLDDTLEHQLADSGSRNGTRLNGERLAPKELAVLRDGDRIDVGGVLFLRFYTPAGMWTELQKLRPA
jgi:pSer/pThr/pTyr-binding forkhead associated (FHA) protein